MSSGDYTNLRKLRRLYYPLIGSHSHGEICHTHTNTTTNINNTPYISCHDHVDISYNCVPTTHCHPNYVHSHSSQPYPYPPPPIIIQSPTPAPAPAPAPIYMAPSHCGMPSSCVDPYISNAKSPSSVTRKEYYLDPKFNGSVTMLVDVCLDFNKGMQVLCISDSNSSNYFEGTIFSYDKPSGEVIIEQIKNLNGSFTNPSKYIVTIYSTSQEVYKLKDRIQELYKEVFNIDISEPEIPDTDVTDADNTAIVNLFNYFFDEDITTNTDYVKSSVYLTSKINYLYTYFFDVDLTANSAVYINGNNVILDSLTDKIKQMNLYFFSNENITTLVA